MDEREGKSEDVRLRESAALAFPGTPDELRRLILDAHVENLNAGKQYEYRKP